MISNRRSWILRILVGVVVLGLLLFGMLAPSTPPLRRTSGPVPQAAYVWQRAWTDDVRAAIAEPPAGIESFVVLAAECQHLDGQWQTVRVAVDWRALAKKGLRVGLAIRIGAYCGPFEREDATARMIVDLARRVLAEVRSAGIEPTELQIDFDCATARLAGYRIWVEMLQAALTKGPPVTITALPTWLNSSDFEALAHSIDGYVLQVHSFERPRAETTLSLCDPAAAQVAVETAARIRVPFRVALPTYGYTVAFDDAGQFIGLAAEGPSPNWPADANIRTVRADPTAMVSLVRTWTIDRPAAMQGILWYRLPVATDRVNWHAETLAAVAAGQTPRANLQLSAKRNGNDLVEVFATNTGNADASAPVTFRVKCGDIRCLAADAVGPYEYTRTPDGIRFHRPAANVMLRPLDTLIIGWLRLAEDTEVTIHEQP
jgi:hypothetical protein